VPKHGLPTATEMQHTGIRAFVTKKHENATHGACDQHDSAKMKRPKDSTSHTIEKSQTEIFLSHIMPRLF